MMIPTCTTVFAILVLVNVAKADSVPAPTNENAAVSIADEISSIISTELITATYKDENITNPKDAIHHAITTTVAGSLGKINELLSEKKIEPATLKELKEEILKKTAKKMQDAMSSELGPRSISSFINTAPVLGVVTELTTEIVKYASEGAKDLAEGTAAITDAINIYIEKKIAETTVVADVIKDSIEKKLDEVKKG